MSQASLVCFVEGGIDAPFYDRVCEVTLVETHEYQIRKAIELPDTQSGGGKNPLLAFHKYMRETKRLRLAFKDRSTTLAFFLDKDIDDILRKRRRCKHIFYTKFYNVENYLYVHGDIVSAISAAYQVTRSAVIAGLGDPPLWRYSAIRHWREWIIFCILNSKTEAGLGSWSSKSQFHHGVRGIVNRSKFEELFAVLRSRTSLQKDVEDRIARLVDKRISNGTADSVFNGKWYAYFLACDAEAGRLGASIDLTGRHSIEGMLLQTLDFRRDWAKPLRQFIESLASGSCTIAAG